MLLDLKFSIGTLGIASGAFIAGLYGMNLKNFFEESDLGFFGVSTWSFVMAALVCSYGLTKLRKLQRVSMWGEQGRKSRGSWRDVDPLPTLPGESRAERLQRFTEQRRAAMREGQGGTRGVERGDGGAGFLLAGQGQGQGKGRVGKGWTRELEMEMEKVKEKERRE